VFRPEHVQGKHLRIALTTRVGGREERWKMIDLTTSSKLEVNLP